MFNNYNISFNQTDCPSEQVLNNYFSGNLSKSEIRKVELHLADCQMCSDYLDGLSEINDMAELKHQTQIILNKINNKSKKNKILYYVTAASILLAIALTTLILIIPQKNKFVAQDLTLSKPTFLNQKIEEKVSENKNSEFEKAGDATDNLKTKPNPLQNINYKGLVRSVTTTVDQTGSVSANTQEEQIYLSQIKTDDVVNEVTISDADKGIITKTEESKVIVSAEKEEKKLDEAVKSIEDTKITSTKDNPKKRKSKVVNSKFSDMPIESQQSPATTGGTVVEYVDTKSDLDNAIYYLKTKEFDVSIIYALKGAQSTNDSIKWYSKMCLAKAFLAKNEKEKSIEIFKEIKQQASGEISKSAQYELEKLGY